MHEGRADWEKTVDFNEWTRVAQVCVTFVNMQPNRAKNYELRDFHPLMQRAKPRKQSAAELLGKLDRVFGDMPPAPTKATLKTPKE